MPAFNESQLEVLKSLADTAFQGFSLDSLEGKRIASSLPTDAPDWQKAQLEKFITTKFSDLPNAIESLHQGFEKAISNENLSQLAMTLSLLNTTAGTLVLTGYTSPFINLTLKQRESILQSWKNSRLLLLRKAFRGFVSITLFVAYNSFDSNALAIGYPALGDPARNLDANRLKKHYPFQFESIKEDYEILNTEILVIGSGAGGGVVSSELSSKGWKVLVIEKGLYLTPEELTGSPKDGLDKLYENGGLIATEDGALSLLAGSNFGGGTTVNWSASFRTGHYIREDWANNYGLTQFLSKDFSDSLEAVCDGMGVSTNSIKHSLPNQMLVDASKSLGYHVDNIPQNTGGNQHSCGMCSFGCVYSEKQSGPVNWLRKAAESGSKFFISTTVEKLLFNTPTGITKPTASTLDKFTPTSSRTKCIGALIRSKNSTTGESKIAIILASESVIVSSGSLHSPAILLRSGLTNPRIGMNLRLHPTTFVTGYYNEPINPWEGSIMTAVSNVAENRDGTHHGIKLEVNMSFPGGSAASFVPWVGAVDHKADMIQFNHAFTLIAIARDRGSGRIFLDKNQHPRIDYALDPYDGLSLLSGIIAAAEIHLTSGAIRIATTQTGVNPYVPLPDHKGLTDPKWIEWIKLVKNVGVVPSKIALGSAHQMGSNQMSVKSSTGVVDSRGRVWGHQNLYIADASVFPTSSAVNPMITNMGTSHLLSKYIHEDLKSRSIEPVSAHL